MNKNESKYFNTAVRMDEALIALKRTDLGARTGRREASDFLAEVGNTSTLL